MQIPLVFCTHAQLYSLCVFTQTSTLTYMCAILLQALGDELRGVCSDYHAEPGLGLSCSVQLSAPSVVDESVENQCMRLPRADPDVRLCPANPTHQYQVMQGFIQGVGTRDFPPQSPVSPPPPRILKLIKWVIMQCNEIQLRC